MLSREIQKDVVATVTTKAPYVMAADSADAPRVVVMDFGIKQNILRSLHEFGFHLTVVPAQTSAEEILAMNPDGVFLSNGPGDPKDVPDIIAEVKKLIGKKPIFGICLGHQLFALAMGADTYKLKFGHRGSNQPVSAGTAAGGHASRRKRWDGGGTAPYRASRIHGAVSSRGVARADGQPLLV